VSEAPPRSRWPRLRLRSKLVLALVVAALVPAVLVATVAVGVILSSLEAGVRDDAQRQLTVSLNLTVRAIERLGDETVQLSESTGLAAALDGGSAPLETWVARSASHLPSARLQVIDPEGGIVFDHIIGGATARFANVGLSPAEARALATQAWSRRVSLVTIADQVVARAAAPLVDGAFALRGVVVLEVPLDGDFADAIKGALSADVLLGGPSGHVAATFRDELGERRPGFALAPDELAAALAGQRVVRDVDTAAGHVVVAVTALRDQLQQPVGLVGVAVDRGALAATRRLALRSLLIGGAGAVGFALLVALLWSRRLGVPIARLQRGATAVSRGDLDHRIEIPGGDELSDLAAAFNQMTVTLKDNQARLAARMREIVALHDAGRAVSSVIDLDQVSRKIVDAVARTFDVQLVALWLVEGGAQPGLRVGAARSRRPDVGSALATDEALATAVALGPLASHVNASRVPLRLEYAGDDPIHGAAARAAGALGPLVALPLDRKGHVVGVLAVARAAGARGFSEADLNLLTTFADQAGAAVENAALYQEVRGASEELERKVRLRTSELTTINTALGRTLADLREAQAQLVLSERMAGLGLLVAGVAHEINSPTAAIRGSIDGLAAALGRVTARVAEVLARAPTADRAAAVRGFLDAATTGLAERRLLTGVPARRAARELATVLADAGVAGATELAPELVDAGADAAELAALLTAVGPDRELVAPTIRALADQVAVVRTASTISRAVAQIQRIVGALKSYSHLDQQPTRTEADLHEGLETTLTLLDHALRDITVERRFGPLPRVPVFVDELNQVWTNLIQNAQQALGGKGTIVIETTLEPSTSPTAGDREGLGEVAVVRVIDDGPGVPEEALPRIFEPFFTTKDKGEGSGLGLGIVRQIVTKHGGEVRCESAPGRTCFEVRLPLIPRTLPEPREPRGEASR
jgi:signal transduction histidine kinase